MYSLILALGTAQTTGDGATGSAGGSMITTLVTFGLIILIFYFLMIRPQRKRDKEAKQMIAAIKKGDKIVTIGGIRGTVAVVKENTVILKVDDNTRIEFNKSAIASVLNKKETTTTTTTDKPSKKEKVALEKVEKPTVEAPTVEVVEPKTGDTEEK